MINNRDLVYDKAEEMAAKYREKMRAQQQGTAPEQTEPEQTEPEDAEIEVELDVEEELIAAAEE
jgi:small subunit ribosomal protein S1